MGMHWCKRHGFEAPGQGCAPSMHVVRSFLSYCFISSMAGPCPSLANISKMLLACFTCSHCFEHPSKDASINMLPNMRSRHFASGLGPKHSRRQHRCDSCDNHAERWL